jgi:hypothetical protein
MTQAAESVTGASAMIWDQLADRADQGALRRAEMADRGSGIS